MTDRVPYRVSRQFAEAAKALWQWWSRTIATILPAPLKRWLVGRQARLIVTIENDQATFLEDLGGRRRRVGSLDLANAMPSEARRIVALVADDPILELPADVALRRQLALPAAAEPNLAEVVSFELERHTPFRRAEAYHGFRIVRRDASQQRILIELTAVPRAVIDDALSRLGPLGIDVAVARTAAETAGAEASPNLLPFRPASRAVRLPRLALSTSVLMALALALAAVILPIEHAHREAAQLEAALDSAKQQAAESARLQTEIDAALRARGFLAERKHQTVPVSRLLEILTRLLPDDTWLSEMRVAGTDLQIAGLGASASAIIGLIDGTPGLSNAGFRSPVTQDQLHREQFDIGAHLGEATNK